jgi:murein DD-endopeptidase MepM/ murein hydrolase activator NlpD
MPISEEFPLAEPVETAVEAQPSEPPPTESGPNIIGRGADPLEKLLRYGASLLAAALVIALLWTLRSVYANPQAAAQVEIPQRAALAAPVGAENAAPQGESALAQGVMFLPPLVQADLFASGIPRLAQLYTTIPNRPRAGVLTYTVQAGDTVFGIADFYSLRPETIFWGNQEVLNDDPHKLFPGQVLNILPVDGVYHKWSAGENLGRVAEFYGVEAAEILEWPGNPLDVIEFESGTAEIDAGTWLIVPGGQREFVDFGPPRITRDNPAVASTYGPGHCGSILDGAVGTGTFVWPTIARYLSGYDYNPAANHSGIDIAGDTGNPIFAADSGVVVYAGWSYFGYGNLVVIDHGQWQTLYAHLSDYYVTCGMSVFQGATIAALGNTGNSSGSHLHFELMYLSAKVNPWDYLSP